MTTLFRLASLAFPALFALAGCEAPPPVKIGFVAGLTGAGADTGLAARNALMMVVDETNKNGGINGRSLELIIRDDQKNTDLAKDLIEEFHKLEVAAIIGPMISSVGSAMLPGIDKHQIVTISPTVSALELANRDDHLFRINSTTSENASIYARKQAELGRKKVSLALDHANAVFTESWAAEFERAFTALGGEVIARIAFNHEKETGFSQPAEQLIATNADAFLLVANGFDSAQLSLQLRKRGETRPIAAAEWAASEELIVMGGSAVEGLEVLQTYDRHSTDPHFQRFVSAYKSRFNAMPGYTSVATHDAATLLVAGLKLQHQAKIPLKNALLQLPPVKGLQQPLRFNSYGDSGRQSYYLIIRDGQFVLQ
ncbi:ABC transporter substrate-binding protein [Thalassospira sp. TSL5-1]|uniref:ABC transporter substrate-binding protein n=1 Tax=Thalassospira sp. TSL5-1 TaxID=1544451 RepID=UPI00093BC363|nr:ABC transporter substrate-binding protein [Thalassospira sp. TSL5-1]OKH87156.1 hypothetical protein LF95_19490 [Thalassospira sp. TSL5-1]